MLFCLCVCSHNFAPNCSPKIIYFCSNLSTVIRLMICYETASSECKRVQTAPFVLFSLLITLHSFFSRSIWHSPCLTYIGAHKLWLLAPFALCAYLMYYAPSDINSDEYCAYGLVYLRIYYMAKTYSLSLALSLPLSMNTLFLNINPKVTLGNQTFQYHILYVIQRVYTTSIKRSKLTVTPHRSFGYHCNEVQCIIWCK